MDIIRVGVAAERLKDIPVQTYVWEALSEKAKGSGRKVNVFAHVDLDYVYDRTERGSGLRFTLVCIGIESPTSTDLLYGPRAFFEEIQIEVGKRDYQKTKCPGVTSQWITARLKVIEDIRRCDEDSDHSSEATASEPDTPRLPVPSKKFITSVDTKRSHSPKAPQPAEAGLSCDTKSALSTYPDPEVALREGLRLDDYRRHAGQVRKTTDLASHDSSSTASQCGSESAMKQALQGSSRTTTKAKAEPVSKLDSPNAGQSSLKPSRHPVTLPDGAISFKKSTKHGAFKKKNRDDGMERPSREPIVPPSGDDLRRPDGACRNFDWKRHRGLVGHS